MNIQLMNRTGALKIYVNGKEVSLEEFKELRNDSDISALILNSVPQKKEGWTIILNNKIGF